MMPMTRYASMAPPGPAWLMVAPLARKRPVPMAPPMAIMYMWRARKLLTSLRVWPADGS